MNKIKTKITGFTLIELMLALAISVILAGIGYPVYVSYQVHVQRVRALVALMQLASRLDNYASLNGDYHGASATGLGIKALSAGLHYRLSLVNVTKAQYVIRASPVGEQAKRDTSCGVLTMTETNARSVSGNGSIEKCWQ